MDLHQQKIIEAAHAFEIETHDISDCGLVDAHILYHPPTQKEILFSNGLPRSIYTYQQRMYCHNKQLTKRFFKRLNIPAAASIGFTDALTQKAKIRNFIREHGISVAKPIPDGGGNAVEINLANYEAVEQYWQKWKGKYEAFVLEKQVAGEDVRLQIIGQKVVAACYRKPAFVVGDGQKRIRELVEIRRKIMYSQNPQNTLVIDEASMDLLKGQAVGLDSIPAEGQEVQLKSFFNMNQGAVAIDITDKIHPLYHKWGEAVAQEFELDIFGLDFLASSPEVDPSENAYALEVNIYPQWLHHTFSEVRTHDIPSMILKEVFEL